MKQRRWIYALFIALNVPAGLASRSRTLPLPALVAQYGGDVLSASCIFFGLRFLSPRTSLAKVLLGAYAICVAIETSQLYQADWIQRLRATYPFGILLGHGFLWSDWVCYAVGVALGGAIALVVERACLKA